jgi:hypothetical protein
MCALLSVAVWTTLVEVDFVYCGGADAETGLDVCITKHEYEI